MTLLSVNAGSSSLKFQVLIMPEERILTSGVVERIGFEEAVFSIKVDGRKESIIQPIMNHEEAVEILIQALLTHNIIASLNDIDGVGHRVVQGGEIFKESALIDAIVINHIKQLSPLAPLHNPANLVGILAFMQVMPYAKHVAVFDTTFHQSMPKETFLYAVPYHWYTKYGVRKYGFHGTSHQYVSQEAMKLLNNNAAKVIVIHMGNGVSLCAIDGGKSVDTSMGLTPLEGVPMGTRSGNVDPALISYLKDNTEMTSDDVLEALNKKSGYLGLSGGFSSDSRDIVDKMATGDELAKNAFDVQVKRVCDYIGSYYVTLGGLDMLCFTAGIGENAPIVREAIVNRLKALGITLDHHANEVKGQVQKISGPDSKVPVYVIPTNEEVMIAREVMKHQ